MVPEFGLLDLPDDSRDFPAFERGLAECEVVGFECDACGTSLGALTTRYHCWQCDDFDLCAACHRQRIHSHHRASRERGSDAATRAMVPGRSTRETLANAFRLFGSRPLLGRRDGGDAFEWISYTQTRRMAERARQRLAREGVGAGAMLGLCAPPSVAWWAVEFGCALGEVCVAPLPHESSAPRLAAMLAALPAVRAVVCADAEAAQLADAVRALGGRRVRLLRLREVAAEAEARPAGGREARLRPSLPLARRRRRPPRPERVHTVIFTSGSTGEPRGVLISDGAWNADVTKASRLPSPLVRLGLCSLAHAMDRLNGWTTLVNGGRWAISQLERVMSDLPLVRPTVLSGPPALWEMVYEAAVAEGRRRGEEGRRGGEEGRRGGEEGRGEGQASEAPAAGRVRGGEAEVGAWVREVLGGRVTHVSSGGAPTRARVLSALKQWLPGVSVSVSYGTTQCGMIATGTSSVLSPLPGVEVRLVPLSYGSEVWVRTATMCSAYTDGAPPLTEDGWYRTGDVATPCGGVRFQLVERCSELIKRSDGKWCCPAQIEAKLADHPLVQSLVRHVCIFADSRGDCLLAVVLPHPHLEPPEPSAVLAAFASAAKQSQLHASEARPCPHHRSILRLRRTHLTTRTHGNTSRPPPASPPQPLHQQRHCTTFSTSAVPVGVHVSSGPWSVSSGHLTPSLKLSRHGVKHAHAAALRSLEEAHAEASAATGRRILALLRGHGLEPHEETAGALSSIAAVRLAQLISAEFDTQARAAERVPALLLLQAKDPLAAAAHFLRTRLPSHAAPPPVDWAAESFLPADICTQSSDDTFAAPPHVLLTGATGFLGRFVLLELLSRTPPSVKVYCLVREPTAAAATAALLAAAGGGLPQARVVALPADVSLPHFGLPHEAYLELRGAVGHVVHCAARVHLLARYGELAGANVRGTLHVLRFVALPPARRLCHISSSSVLLPDGRDVIPLHQLDRCCGYVQTKVVAELLVREAHRRGVAVCVARMARLAGHSRTGESNRADFVSLLLCGMIESGCAPRARSEQKVCFDMLPVDYVASAVVQLALRQGHANEESPKVHLPVLHLSNCLRPLRLDWMLQRVAAAGFKLQAVELDPWRQMIRRSKSLQLFADALDVGIPSDCVMVGEGTVCDLHSVDEQDAQITEAVFDRYLDFFCRCGMITTTKENSPNVCTARAAQAEN
ncbi:hypothetical protein AB1Y20_010929 [Prymnesium parvum]|uniref:ZZ-type domain-containing protein n=1 Tax=Prymnesium parvum TaxID=97485 RepID=A0AB34ISQ8_PRYPA